MYKLEWEHTDVALPHFVNQTSSAVGLLTHEFGLFKHESRHLLLISSQKATVTFYMSQRVCTNLSGSILMLQSITSLPKRLCNKISDPRFWPFLA